MSTAGLKGKNPECDCKWVRSMAHPRPRPRKKWKFEDEDEQEEGTDIRPILNHTPTSNIQWRSRRVVGAAFGVLYPFPVIDDCRNLVSETGYRGGWFGGGH